jgi:hypothetical protein
MDCNLAHLIPVLRRGRLRCLKAVDAHLFPPNELTLGREFFGDALGRCRIEVLDLRGVGYAALKKHRVLYSVQLGRPLLRSLQLSNATGDGLEAALRGVFTTSRDPNGRLETLVLQNACVGKWLPSLLRAPLRTLALPGARLGDTLGAAVAGSLTRFTTLRSLNLDDCGLGANALRYIALCVPRLNDLSLRRNEIGALQEWGDLIRGFEASKLHSVYLRQCGIRQARTLGAWLARSAVHFADLAANPIDLQTLQVGLATRHNALEGIVDVRGCGFELGTIGRVHFISGQ